MQVVLCLLVAMWVLEVVDVALDHRLDQYGIEPRDLDGLDGVVAAPFLHADFGHLIANTIPFVALGIVIGFQGVARVLAVTGIVDAGQRSRHLARGAGQLASTSAPAGSCSATRPTCSRAASSTAT